ncbi:threonine/serine dehydratase [Evansella sp. LMS18]|jgi:threonine dehydratase|uniref:threonine/serine dehydratase n=1 Tax=Evansella sp. LMS18 TaxID=2924033 RepID=UPI0020CFF2BA|nr:threonine/serine dehydratase [Evansella sp. LMS18]UTR08703.1 threonine/serine dehydratase [Evansella sp. LMS18]
MISLNDIKQARENISGIIHKTPIIQSEQLSGISGNDVYLKGEHVQKTGSFKIRGASNKVISAVRGGAGKVTAASSGNHGQAVAYISKKLNVPATVVVPEDAALCKINAISSYGAGIEKCGTTSAERIPKAMELAESEGGVFIPPYDDPLVMAGQGTTGLEIIEELDDIDAIIVPVGGGGLLSGILTAVKETNPAVKVYGAEPLLANDTFLSLQNQKITSIPTAPTIADGLRSSQPGDMTFPVLMKYLDDLILVNEDEIKQSFFFVLERLKQLIEPSSAVAVAAAMYGKIPLEGKKVAVVLSGGNVDLGRLSDLMPEDRR